MLEVEMRNWVFQFLPTLARLWLIFLFFLFGLIAQILQKIEIESYQQYEMSIVFQVVLHKKYLF